VLTERVLRDLRPGDRCVLDDQNYSHAAGQEVIVVDTSAASDLRPPPGETRMPVLVPESGRLLLQVGSTPVLVEG
jgi:hypothetical protein